jgi:hypothetical protein
MTKVSFSGNHSSIHEIHEYYLDSENSLNLYFNYSKGRN